jgi:hypothetical protein
MRQVLTIILIIAAILLANMVYDKTMNFKKTHGDEGAAVQVVPNGTANNPMGLRGLPPEQESFLENAMGKDLKTFKKWLDYWGPKIEDPRRAWIELDYAVMASRDDLAEARRVFAAVKARLPKNSPVFPRMKSLEKAYE